MAADPGTGISKKIVRTVCGDIPASELGACYPHEHVFGAPPPHLAEIDFMLNDPGAALLELTRFREAGGRALVDMSTLDYNRDAAGLKEVSRQTRVHIVSATGFNKDKFSKKIVDELSDTALHDLLYNDVTRGFEGSDIRAGVLKASSTLNAISDTARRVFDAVASVHLETGAPISTHTEAGTMAMEQVELFLAKRIQPASIVIGHLDRKLDMEYILDIAQTGVFLGIDQISKEKYYPDRERIDVILALIEAGHGQQILLSGDLARRSYWPGYGNFGGPGLTYILWRFIPWLREAGVDAATLHQLIVDNPGRALSFVPLHDAKQANWD